MKLNLKDLEKYLFPLKRIFSKYRQIRSVEQVKTFVQEQSAQVSQMTLYGYLKTRMGAKHVLMFEDEIFLGSINKAKWNIYVVALQDLTLYSISYLKDVNNLHDTEKAKELFFNILNDEKKNNIPTDVFEKASAQYNQRLKNINWSNYYKDLPFNESALALYEWSPIADELKILDKKIVLNSMILKWDNIRKEFKELISF